jgi:thiosulfate/3-mercaptopyruvate sulfurtransferase
MRYFSVLIPALCAAQGMLVDTTTLAKQLRDPALVVLHVGSQKDYDEAHIPGARLVMLGDISVTEGGLRLQLPPVGQLQEAFEKLGVRDTSRIVVYPATESVQSATRVWFTLDYLGLGDRTALLDGGLPLWKAEGRPVSSEPATPARGGFTPKPRPQTVVDAAFIRDAKSRVDLIDARTSEFYSGANAGMMPRAGRIPGARHVPYTSLLDDKLRFRSAPDLRKALGEPGRTRVTYCHIGQQATVPYFAARMLGYEVRLYDGSFQDWSARADLPVEGDSKP